MKNLIRLLSSTLLIFAFFINALPCGPSYITPVFESEKAPDNPYSNFAAGNLGIVKPTYRRIVLLAAYRYLTGGGFSDPEQKALVEVWDADFNNKEPQKKSEMDEAVKNWVEKRKSVVGKEEKPPEIYAERSYGGYDFFPNCTKNAFETATKTLGDRIISNGSDDKNVREWTKAQDQVFENCASGKSIPGPPSPDMAEWLQKDRAYQVAAAEFYALDYQSARRRFSEIAEDFSSPWQETAEYLVGRTLIREASLSKDRMKAESLYMEADQKLQSVAMKSGKFSEDAEKLLGIVKYRLRPQERVRELAQKLTQPGNSNFRQDVIDYNWLLDKFEKETLEKEEARKAQEELQKSIAANGNSANSPANVFTGNVNTNSTFESRTNDNEISIYIYSDDYQQTWNFTIKADATDTEAIAEAEKTVGKPLTEKMKEQVRSQRKAAYADRFSQNIQREYQGGYYGEEPLTRSILPDFLRDDDLSDWLFTYQIQGTEAYLYALTRFRQSGADLWLMTALTKAEKSSTELDKLLAAARKIPPSSPAYPTISFNLARILIETGKAAEARKYIDEMLNSSVEMPISSRNQFLKLRMSLAETLEDFLVFAQRKPFAFDFDGQKGTLDEFVAEQKSWYSPESYPDQTREQYEKSVEEQFARYKKIENELMLDQDAFSILNFYFPSEVLVQAQKSEKLPKYLRKRLAMAIWTRAVLFENELLAKTMTPILLDVAPEFTESFAAYQKAVTPVARKRDALYIILKNPILTPNIESGFDSDNEFNQWDDDDWWCTWWYNEEGETESAPTVAPPGFLTKAQITAAKMERDRLGKLGDAPKYLAEKVLEWQKLAPADKRIPESLFIVYQANGWTKYGCGNNIEIQEQTSTVLRKRYPNSEWTKKLDAEPEQ